MVRLEMADGKWSLNEQIYSTIPSGSSIAAASSYSKDPSGFETWIELLSASSNQGFEVDTWSGAINDWLEQYTHPMSMNNETRKGGRICGNVAVTAMGTAFGAIQPDGGSCSIESWQVDDDMVDWTFTGYVDLDGAWEP